MIAFAVLSVVIAGWLGKANIAWFIAGSFYGGLFTLWLVVFELLDPVTRHWIQGAEGEEFTGHELDRCKRQGWRAIHNLHLKAGDIDHIAIGPGGVVVIETKCPDADWAWLSRSKQPSDWVRQVNASALRTRALIQQHAHAPVDVRPIVVVWAKGLVDAGTVRIDGVLFLHGSQLGKHLRGLTPTLNESEVQRIHEALNPVAQQLQRHHDQPRLTPARA